jgi:hypothetical protein
VKNRIELLLQMGCECEKCARIPRRPGWVA